MAPREEAPTNSKVQSKSDIDNNNDDGRTLGRVGTPEKLSVPLNWDGWIKDANGWIHCFKDGKDQPRPYHCQHTVAMVPDDLTLEQVNSNYDDVLARWRRSAECTTISDLLRSNVVGDPGLKIDSCVCACIGVFTANHPYCARDGGETSMKQLALLETILDILREQHDIKNLYIQDPAMNELDHAFVRSRGFRVLEDPSAQNIVTPTSLLFAISFEWSVMDEIFEFAYPAVFIGSPLENYHACHIHHKPENASEEENRRAKDIFDTKEGREYDRLYKPFLDICDQQEFHLTLGDKLEKIYWRRSGME